MIELRALGLREGALVLVDTAPIIYYIDEGAASRRGAVFAAFAEAARSGRLRLVVSAIAWTELLCGPLAAGDDSRATAYRRLLADSSLLRVEPIEVSIAEEAARLVARRRGRPPLALADAIHLATALALGAEAALTNDEAWRDFAPEVRVLLLDEMSFAE